MTAKVRDAGWYRPSATNNEWPKEAKRAVLTTSTGGVIVVVADMNSASAVVGQGERNGTSKIYVYESTDRVTFTLRATITTGALMKQPLWAAELFSDNSVGIVYRLATGAIQYNKVTYGTWAVSANETVQAAVASVTYRDLDISVSDGDVPLVFILREHASTNPRQQCLYRIRRTSDSTWFAAGSHDVLTTSAPAPWILGLTGQVLRGGSATARNVMTLHVATSPATDSGCRLYTTVINETTGALSTVVSQVVGITSGDLKSDDYSEWSTPRRVMLWSNAVGQATFAIMTLRRASGTGARMTVGRYAWDGTTFSTVIPPTSANSSYVPNSGTGMAATFGDNAVMFHFSPDSNGDGKYDMISYTARLGSTTATFKGPYKWNNLADAATNQMMAIGNGSRNSSFQTHDMIFGYYVSTTNADVYHNYLIKAPGPTAFTPANGSSQISSIPTISASADLDRAYGQTAYKAVWQFASDAGFTTNLKEFIQTDTKFLDINGTDTSGTVVTITDVLPTAYSLPQGTWYARAALIDYAGKQGNWSATNSFSIAHPPAAIPKTPSLGQTFLYGGGTVTVTWDFTDPSGDDYQTAYQVLVTKVSDGSTVYDSGKVSSASEAHTTGVIASGNKDILLQWQVKLWDRDDVPGAYSPPNTFILADNPTITITTPAASAVLNTAMPFIQLDGTVGGTRRIKYYKIVITQGSTVVHQTALVAVDLASPYTIGYTPPLPVLKNNQNYTITAYVVDSVGLSSAVATRQVSTSWTPPATPQNVTIDVSHFNVENEGYVLVGWDDAVRDTDFTAWIIYRRADEIDQGTLAVVEEGEWEEVSRVYNISTPTYSFKDYWAPSAHAVRYRVTQLVNRFGDLVESEDDVKNLARNPSAEVDATLFNTVTGGAITQDNAWANSGTKSFLFTATGGAVGTAKLTGDQIAPNANRFGVSQIFGSNLYASARFKAGAAATMAARFEISFYNSSGTIIGSTSNGATASGAAGTEFTVSHGVAIPAGTVAAEVNLRMGRSGLASFSAADLLAFDSIIISYNNAAYFDGNTEDAVWDGTPGLSASRYTNEYVGQNTAYPMSDGYWLIEPESPDKEASAFILDYVVSDAYTDEWEEEEFTVVGRGRHVDRGEHLGLKGSLEIQVRDTANGRTARQKKKRLEVMKEENRQLYLRTPFGDVYRVYAGNMSVSRLAGVGKAELVDVTIPYSQVGD